jgi:hypothetical protein
MGKVVLKDFTQLRAELATVAPRQVQPAERRQRKEHFKHPPGERTQADRQALIGTIPDLEIEPGWTVESITTLEECEDARLRLVEIIASIESQLARAAAEKHETGEYADRHWWRRTQVALRLKKAALQRVQNLRSEIRRKAREGTQQSRERAIIEALRAIDPAALYKAIAVAKEAHPQLFEDDA